MYYHVTSEMKKKIWSILGKQYLYLNKILMVGYIHIYIYNTFTELTKCISIYVLFLSTILIFVLFFENN